MTRRYENKSWPFDGEINVTFIHSTNFGDEVQKCAQNAPTETHTQKKIIAVHTHHVSDSDK